MKRINIRNYIFPILGIIGLLNYIPVLYYPSFLNSLYFNYKLIIIATFFLLLIILTIFSVNRTTGIIVLVIYITVLLFSKQIRSIENNYIVEFNKDRNISDFVSPILGYKLILPNKTNQNIYDIEFDALFKFNDIFGVYQALVFKRNHNLTMNSFDGDFSLYKIYNQDWWWYRKSD